MRAGHADTGQPAHSAGADETKQPRPAPKSRPQTPRSGPAQSQHSRPQPGAAKPSRPPGLPATANPARPRGAPPLPAPAGTPTALPSAPAQPRAASPRGGPPLQAAPLQTDPLPGAVRNAPARSTRALISALNLLDRLLRIAPPKDEDPWPPEALPTLRSVNDALRDTLREPAPQDDHRLLALLRTFSGRLRQGADATLLNDALFREARAQVAELLKGRGVGVKQPPDRQVGRPRSHGWLPSEMFSGKQNAPIKVGIAALFLVIVPALVTWLLMVLTR